MKTLKRFEFTEKRTGSDRRYDWDTLLNGQIVQLNEGDDYTCKVNTIIAVAKKTAEKRGQTLQYQKVEGGVVIQASDPATATPPANGTAE